MEIMNAARWKLENESDKKRRAQMKPVFLQYGQNIFYLVSGQENDIPRCLPEGANILDESSSEGAGEKHLPVVEKKGEIIHVQVGSIEHPMTLEHSIQWVFLETKKGGQFAYLLPDQKPDAFFVVEKGDEAVAAHIYCNQHGIWKTEITS